MTAKTRATFKTDSAAALADNTTGAITPAVLRAQLVDFADSVTFPDDIATNIANGATAFGWGDHAAAGYLTGVSEAAVTAHQAALSLTQSQIGDLGNVVKSDTTYAKGGTVAKGVVFITRAAHAAITNPPADVLYAFTD